MASLIFLFFITSPTIRTFLGDIRIILAFAIISIDLFLSLRHFRLSVTRMAVKGPGRREFSQLMTHHFLGYKDRYKLLPVMDSKGKSDKLGRNGRSS